MSTNQPPKFPPLELKVLIAGPGINVVSTVTITDTPIKDLLAYPDLHKDLVAGSQMALVRMVENYNGIVRGEPVKVN